MTGLSDLMEGGEEGGIREDFWVLAWASERLEMPFMEIGKSGGDGVVEVRVTDSAVDMHV